MANALLTCSNPVHSQPDVLNGIFILQKPLTMIAYLSHDQFPFCAVMLFMKKTAKNAIIEHSIIGFRAKIALCIAMAIIQLNKGE